MSASFTPPLLLSPGVPYCDNLRIIPHSPNGFRVTGADSCHYTNSMSINVTSHSCNEPDVSVATSTYMLTGMGIGVHAFHISPYLYEFFEPILFFDTHGL